MSPAHTAPLSRNKLALRLVAALVAVALVLTAAAGGTHAVLFDETAPVVNTFTCGNVGLNLTETDTGLDGDKNANTNEYQMVPGQSIAKDPKLTLKAGSVDSWLFVKLEKSANFDTYLGYEVADGWTALNEAEGVYYREVSKGDADQEFHVIANDKVQVKDAVTKQMLNALESDYPTLKVTGYAVQKAGFDTAAAAWQQAQGAESEAAMG